MSSRWPLLLVLLGGGCTEVSFAVGESPEPPGDMTRTYDLPRRDLEWVAADLAGYVPPQPPPADLAEPLVPPCAVLVPGDLGWQGASPTPPPSAGPPTPLGDAYWARSADPYGEPRWFADIDGDGATDVFRVAYGLTESGYGVAWGSGVLGYPSAMYWGPFRAPVDLDGDGRVELVSVHADGSSSGGSPSLDVHRATPSALSPVESHVVPAGKLKDVLAHGDFDGDGRMDVLTDWHQACAGLALWRGGPTGLEAPILVPTAPGRFATADLNGDGRQDFVRADAVDFSVLLGDGAGGFVLLPSFGFEFIQAFSLVDVDLDGRVDSASVTSSELRQRRGLGDGSFAAPEVIAAPVGATLDALVVGDFDGNGAVDLVVRDWNDYELRLVLGNGDGTYLTPITLAGACRLPLVTGDRNNDGAPDLLCQDHERLNLAP